MHQLLPGQGRRSRLVPGSASAAVAVMMVMLRMVMMMMSMAMTICHHRVITTIILYVSVGLCVRGTMRRRLIRPVSVPSCDVWRSLMKALTRSLRRSTLRWYPSTMRWHRCRHNEVRCCRLAHRHNRHHHHRHNCCCLGGCPGWEADISAFEFALVI